jgi:hypothetical protein
MTETSAKSLLATLLADRGAGVMPAPGAQAGHTFSRLAARCGAAAAAWLCVALFAVAVGAAPARAQRSDMEESYFAGKLMLGVGGEAELDTAIGDFEDDLELSWGAGFMYMARLHRHFALGGLFAFQSWQGDAREDADLDRNLLFDLAVVPQGVLPVSDDLELYVALGLGLSLDMIGDDEIVVGGVSVAEVDSAFGLAVLPVLGLRFAVSRDVGLIAELGYSLHSYEHEASGGVGGFGASTEFDLSLGQVALNFGVSF